LIDDVDVEVDGDTGTDTVEFQCRVDMLARNLKDSWSLTQKCNHVWAFFVPNNP
jgi:hypothetical protein